jgi:hypothetical protein
MAGGGVHPHRDFQIGDDVHPFGKGCVFYQLHLAAFEATVCFGIRQVHGDREDRSVGTEKGPSSRRTFVLVLVLVTAEIAEASSEAGLRQNIADLPVEGSPGDQAFLDLGHVENIRG